MVAVNYLWNPINDNIVREFDDAGSVVAEYTTEPEPYGNVVSQFRGGQTNYLHSDALGSTTELTNDAGSVTDTIRYSAFGEVTQRTGTTEMPFQYVGQKGYYKDALTQEYAARRRAYVPKSGRWSSLDPLAIPLLSWLSARAINHSYAYASNSPIRRWDPSGQKDEMMCEQCKRMIMNPPLTVIPLHRCLIAADCPVDPKCVCCSEKASGCAFIGKDGSYNIRLCCGQSNEDTMIHEYIHVLRLCQAKKKKAPLAKDCNECVREEILSFVCAGFCEGKDALGRERDARSCIESAFQSCLLAAGEADVKREKAVPAPGTQPCNEGEDPKAVPFQGCKKHEIERLRSKMDDLIRSIKEKYGDPPSRDSDACKGIFDTTKCMEFVPPEIVGP